jgi:hypothetical protein
MTLQAKPPLAYPDVSLLPHAIFPILPIHSSDEEGTRLSEPGPRVFCDPHEQGSAFFLSTSGLFLTARHVVEKHDRERYSVMAVQRQTRGFRYCRVTALALHPELDVAVGIAEEPGSSGWPYPFALATQRLGNGSAILEYGYAETQLEIKEAPSVDELPGLGIGMFPKVYRGRVEERVESAPFIPGPCYRVSCDAGGGMSGGPLIRKRTMRVHGVVSRGARPIDGDPYGYAVDVVAFVDRWQIPFLDGRTLRDHVSILG